MTAKRPTSVSDQRVHAQPVKNTHTFRGMSEIAVLFKTSSFKKKKKKKMGANEVKRELGFVLRHASGWYCKG